MSALAPSNPRRDWTRSAIATLFLLFASALAHDLERQVKDLGKQIEVKIYTGAKHAFFNDTRPEVYDADAAADAWQRTIKFFREHLH